MSLLEEAKKSTKTSKHQFTKEVVEVFVAFTNGEITSGQAMRVLAKHLQSNTKSPKKTNCFNLAASAIREGIRKDWVSLKMK